MDDGPRRVEASEACHAATIGAARQKLRLINLATPSSVPSLRLHLTLPDAHGGQRVRLRALLSVADGMRLPWG